ncbi:MAG: HD domain-containing protein [Deltaproteobacteria bacterium]|nr:HD domain-containing protein [Deltaproteobacteria bacterium]
MRTGYLEILNGPFQGQKHRFHSRITIGRKSSNGVRLLDPKVSRTHAKIQATEEGFRIEDLKSRNGIYINEKKSRNRLLRSGDKIKIGFTELHFTEKGINEVQETDPLATIAIERKLLDLTQSEFDEHPSAQAEASLPAQRFQSIMRINQAIGGDLELKLVLEKILEEIFLVLRPERGAIMALNEDSGELDIVCSRPQIKDQGLDNLLISRSILNRVLEESVGILIDDATTDNRFALSESISIDQISSALCVPLVQNKEVVGIIYLDAPSKIKAFTAADLDLLMTIAGPASVQIQNALYFNQLQRSYKDTIRALAKAVDARDPYTVGHNWRVSRLAVTVASSLGWSEEELRTVEFGGILHDIGKIGVPDSIFLQPGKLAEEEWQIMKQHPEIGAQMIGGIDFLERAIPFILYHHEHWDGGGYPYGLQGNEIPREGRLLLVCDSFDAMTTTRPYRNGLKPEVAIEELAKGKKKQFDPYYVDAFVTTWQNGDISDSLKENEEGTQEPAQSLQYSNFQSLIISKDGVIQEHKIAGKTDDQQGDSNHIKDLFSS